MSIIVRYPGRACLLGEHCDWAGGASLAVPLPMWVEVAASGAHEGITIQTQMDDELLEGQWPVAGEVNAEGGPLRFVPAGIAALAEQGISVPPALLSVHATLPTGRGFSSSAAFTLAVLDAMSRLAGQPQSTEVLAELAYRVEHDLLGVDCGRLDQLSCAAGTPVFLQWNEGRAPLVRISPTIPFHLVVAAFSRPRDTRAILAALNHWHGADITEPDPTGAISAVRVALDVFGACAERGARALQQGDPECLGEAMNLAQQAYDEELATTLPELRAPLLQSTCRALREEGALGAKFSGAGGDGSAIALFASEAAARSAVNGLGEQGIAAWYAPVGGV